MRAVYHFLGFNLSMPSVLYFPRWWNGHLHKYLPQCWSKNIWYLLHLHVDIPQFTEIWCRNVFLQLIYWGFPQSLKILRFAVDQLNSDRSGPTLRVVVKRFPAFLESWETHWTWKRKPHRNSDTPPLFWFPMSTLKSKHNCVPFQQPKRNRTPKTDPCMYCPRVYQCALTYQWPGEFGDPNKSRGGICEYGPHRLAR